MPLSQFGYQVFQNAAEREPVIAAVGDDYLIGIGDRLRVSLRGQTSRTETVTIGSDGLLFLASLDPLPAAGQSLGALREALEAEVSRTLSDTRVFVALANVRRIDVLVTGAVTRPGRLDLTSFATLIDALTEAGGPTATGSLRRIRLLRGDWQRQIDLYDLLQDGAADADPQLRDGDRIVVPPIGGTIALAGAVKRPGIYELPPGSDLLSPSAALALAGGPFHRAGNRMLVLGFDEAGQSVTRALNSEDLLGDGDVLLVQRQVEGDQGVVTLSGPVRNPGRHALARADRLSKLLTHSSVEREAYPLLGVIERFVPDSFEKTLIGFVPQDVLRGGFDRRLSDGDRVRLFTWPEIRRLTGIDADTALTGPTADPRLSSMIANRLERLDGGIAVPGNYPIGGPVTLRAAVETAGGISAQGDPARVEIAFRDARDGRIERRLYSLLEPGAGPLSLTPGDAVTVLPRAEQRQLGAVQVSGAVRRPGLYRLLPGERLASVIERAGGLLAEAHPEAAVFTRERLRRDEQRRLSQALSEIDEELAALLEDPGEADNVRELREAQALIEELQSAPSLGRMIVQADPAKLGAGEPENIFLEAGDHLHYPVRSATVHVTGEVLSPAALRHNPAADPRDYIAAAGGTTQNADRRRAFIVLPDGSAQPLRSFTRNYSGIAVPPGSTIVVPRDGRPLDVLELTAGITNILSQLAIGSAAISVVTGSQ